MTEAAPLLTQARSLLATFVVGESLFALDAASVQEVIRIHTITPVPHAPAEVVGVINLRGRIVTLLDAGPILASAPASRSRDSRIFLIEDQGEFIGLLVDAAGEVIESDPAQWEALPLNIPPHRARLFRGVCRSDGRVITLLNPFEILAGDRAIGPLASTTKDSNP